MKAVNSQFRSITNLIRSEKSDWEADRDKSLEDQIKDRFQDLSDTCDLENSMTAGSPAPKTAARSPAIPISAASSAPSVWSWISA